MNSKQDLSAESRFEESLDLTYRRHLIRGESKQIAEEEEFCAEFPMPQIARDDE
jgi:hypothetical protein